VKIGARCTIHPNATIGADGFGFAPAPEGWTKIQQLASVDIGNDVEIGANSTVDRGALEDTVVEDGVIIDNLVQIGHGVRVGTRTAIAAQVGISGGTQIGARCVIAGQAGMAGHLTIADDVHIGGQGRVASSVTEPGHYSSGTPVQPLRAWLRNASRFTQLDKIVRRLVALEKAVGLEQGGDQDA
jgi:UDP-3-O-[3-hydroxymyristoyl] glucosamine N-acyltransferase